MGYHELLVSPLENFFSVLFCMDDLQCFCILVFSASEAQFFF